LRHVDSPRYGGPKDGGEGGTDEDPVGDRGLERGLGGKVFIEMERVRISTQLPKFPHHLLSELYIYTPSGPHRRHSVTIFVLSIIKEENRSIKLGFFFQKNFC